MEDIANNPEGGPRLRAPPGDVAEQDWTMCEVEAVPHVAGRSVSVSRWRADLRPVSPGTGGAVSSRGG